MKNLTTRPRLASLLPQIVVECRGACGQLAPIGDSYSNTASPATSYASKTVLDVESTQTSFMPFNPASIRFQPHLLRHHRGRAKAIGEQRDEFVTSAVLKPKDSGLLAPTGISRQA
jgi:hypothetical protein